MREGEQEGAGKSWVLDERKGLVRLGMRREEEGKETKVKGTDETFILFRKS